MAYFKKSKINSDQLAKIVSCLSACILILIIIFAVLAFRTAISRDFIAHRRWALRLFLVVNGVWFFRVGLMFWLFVNGGPVGFDMVTFQGPFLTSLSFAVYLGALPLTILELYLFAQKQSGAFWKFSVAFLLFVLILVMGIGIFAATMGMWLPHM